MRLILARLHARQPRKLHANDWTYKRHGMVRTAAGQGAEWGTEAMPAEAARRQEAPEFRRGPF